MKHFLQTNLEKTKIVKIVMSAIINAAVDKYLSVFSCIYIHQ